MRFEDLNELSEVGQGSRQAIDLVDDHDVDLASLDIGHELLEAGPVDIAACEAAIIIGGLDKVPALVGLGLYIGLTCLALGIQRVELLFEPFLGRLPRIDRTAKALYDLLSHE